MNQTEDNPRGRRRSYHACLNCRRKKTRCPGEKPACSSCVRLKQSCAYPQALRAPRNGRSEERLAHLEEKLDRLLNGSLPQQPNDETNEKISEKSSVSPPAIESVANKRRQSTVSFESDSQRPGPSDITTGIRLYFDYCHRQPIWCFERDEIKDTGSVPEHLVCSILALTARFSHRKEALQRYGSSARQLIMHCVVNGTVDITVLESLCLLSYSSFIGMIYAAHRSLLC